MKNGYINLQWLLAALEDAPLLSRKECEDVALVALLGELHKQKSALDAAIERDTEECRNAEVSDDPVRAEYFKGKIVAEMAMARWMEKVIYDELEGRSHDN